MHPAAKSTTKFGCVVKLKPPLTSARNSLLLRKPRVQREVADEDEWPINTLTGLNSFCLVTREEIPSGMHNLFSLIDVDRDGMIDMVYLREDKSTM